MKTAVAIAVKSFFMGIPCEGSGVQKSNVQCPKVKGSEVFVPSSTFHIWNAALGVVSIFSVLKLQRVRHISRHLVDQWTKMRGWYRFTISTCCLKPSLFRMT